MTCSPIDVVCGIQQALAPILTSIALVIVLLFIGAFGGKPGKVIAVSGIIILYLWWFGFSEIGLSPIRHYAGQSVIAGAALALMPDPFEWRRWRESIRFRGVQHG